MRCETAWEQPPVRGRRTTAPPRSAGLSGPELVGVLALILVPVLLMGLGRMVRDADVTSRELPGALLGTWFTDAPEYAGRSLGFSPGHVVVTRGEGDRVSYAVRSVERISDRSEVAYRILHVDGEGIDHILEVHMSDETTLHLLRPADVVWRRR